MSRPKKKNQAKSPKAAKSTRSAKQESFAEETRAAEALTIMWTLLVTTGVGCDLGAAVAQWIYSGQPENKAIGLLSFLLLFAAVVVGTLIVGLMPVVYRLRKVPPPRAYAVFALLVGIAPILALLVLAMQ